MTGAGQQALHGVDADHLAVVLVLVTGDEVRLVELTRRRADGHEVDRVRGATGQRWSGGEDGAGHGSGCADDRSSGECALHWSSSFGGSDGSNLALFMDLNAT